MPGIEAALADFILGPSHVGFIVEDLELAVSNACRVYGVDASTVRYEPAPGVEAATRFAFLSVGSLEFEYIQPVEEPYLSMLLGMPSGGAGINHVAWRVCDIDAAMLALRKRGIGPGHVTPDGVIDIGSKRMVYLDPASTGGLVIELIQHLGEGSGDG